MTAQEARRLWLEHLAHERRASPRTVEAYGFAAARYIAFLEQHRGESLTVAGLGDVSAADAGETVTLPGSGTNGGECLVGPFPPDRFNDPATGRVNLAYDAVTGLTVAAVKLRGYA